MGPIGGFRHGHCDPILVALENQSACYRPSGPSTNHNDLTPACLRDLVMWAPRFSRRSMHDRGAGIYTPCQALPTEPVHDWRTARSSGEECAYA